MMRLLAPPNATQQEINVMEVWLLSGRNNAKSSIGEVDLIVVSPEVILVPTTYNYFDCSPVLN